MDNATQESKSGSKAGKLVARVVKFTALAAALVLAVKEYNVKNSATKTAEAWRESLVIANENDEDLTQEDLDKLTQGNPSVAYSSARAGQTEKNFSWSRILGADYKIKVTFVDKAVKPSVAAIEPLW